MAVQREIRFHNATTLSSLEVGDRVEFPRGRLSHWGLFIGDAKIIHLLEADDDGMSGKVQHSLSISGNTFKKGIVKIENFWDIVGESKAIKNNQDQKYGTPESIEIILQRAYSKLGNTGYNVFWNNCEHFASFCRYGQKHSEQAEKAVTALSIGGACLVVGKLCYDLFSAYMKKK